MTIVNPLDLDTLHLEAGSHSDPDQGMCILEAVAYIAGEPFTDHPECASPVLGAFLRGWNDSLDDEHRQELVQYIPRLVGSKGTPEQEDARAWLAMDWLVRVYTPRWLRLAKLNTQAVRFEALPEFKAGMSVPSVRPTIEAVRKDASAAWSAAWSAVESAAWGAVESAAWGAAWSAAESAVESAVESAAWGAARSAAESAAATSLAPTVDLLRADAHQLVNRMLEVTGS